MGTHNDMGVFLFVTQFSVLRADRKKSNGFGLRIDTVLKNMRRKNCLQGKVSRGSGRFSLSSVISV